ncbi:hypothetical protein [Caloranaerobacter sp. DY30410]|uniref:hypothetical protein n=1 Tax=Caloranaerobacter sp. DY30410 TaxID=3238305 RepID=UPI003D08978A
MRKVILFLIIIISLTACTTESKLNISKDINECLKKGLEITSFNAKIYISEYSTASQEQDHLYGAIYDLEFVLPVECKDIFREEIKSKLLIELKYPEEIHYFSGFSSAIGDIPVLKSTKNGKAYFTTNFSNLISRNEPVSKEDLLKIVDPDLEFQLKIYDHSNNNVLLEKTLNIEPLN